MAKILRLADVQSFSADSKSADPVGLPPDETESMRELMEQGLHMRAQAMSFAEALLEQTQEEIKAAQPISVSRISLQLCPENHAALGEVASLSWRTRFCLGIKLMLGGTNLSLGLVDPSANLTF